MESLMTLHGEETIAQRGKGESTLDGDSGKGSL